MSFQDKLNAAIDANRPATMELPDEDAAWVEDRMTRMANSAGRMEDLETILLAGMTPGEERAFCLGVRSGKHWAAILVLQAVREFGPEVAKTLDPYIK
jgi:hypothetical protein